jgi:hypothetical protein
MSQVSTICCTSTLSPLSSTSTPSTLNPQPKPPVCTSDPPSHPPFLRLNHHPLSRKPSALHSKASAVCRASPSCLHHLTGHPTRPSCVSTLRPKHKTLTSTPSTLNPQP